MRKVLLTSAAGAALLFGAPAMANPEPGTTPEQQQFAAGERTGAGTTAAPAARADADPFRSYRFHQDQFAGTFANDYAADQLMHQRVADARGEQLGVITDLLIGADDQVQHVVVETPVPPYESFVLDTAMLQPEEGAQADFSVEMTRQQLAEVPRYHMGEPGVWMPGPPALRPQQ